MNLPLMTVELRFQPDIVLARQRARQIAQLLGFVPLDQTRIATAVSEIARNAFEYGNGGKVDFQVKPGRSPEFVILIHERGPGIKDLQAILEGRYDSSTGLGVGILGAKRLMDDFSITTSDGGVTVSLAKSLPAKSLPFVPKDLAKVSAVLAQASPQGLFEELQHQNQELLRTLQELRDRQSKVSELHSRELEETNRGVVALYSELDENAKELQRISDLKSRYLSTMSHEFRSPLNTILSMTGFLLNGSSGELSSEQEKEVGFIRKAAEGLAALVNDLLDLAKVEAGKAVIRSETFDVAGLFDTLRGTTNPLLANSSVKLVVDEPIEVRSLQTDEGKVTQILRNFLSNAAKFTEKGEIRLSSKDGPGNMVIFSVTDTGIGIAPEDYRRIFEEFGQIEGPLQRKTKGTGLGLPLSRKLAELLGGAVSVQSKPGMGSTFYAVIPRIYEELGTSGKATDVARSLDTHRTPILIVEDDPVDLLLYEKFLQGTEFQPIPARSLREARTTLRQAHPAVVLLDLVLKGENGWTLLAELKRNPKTKDIPVLVLTAVESREQALALGAADFRLKPIDPEWLLERLGELIADRSSCKVLIIDNDEADRYVLKTLLSIQGELSIVEASSGREGLQLAREVKPDVMFLDLIMDDMTGFEVLNRLKSDEVLRKIPVIINSSLKLSDDQIRRLDQSAAAVLSKSTEAGKEASVSIRDALIRAGVRLASPSPRGES